MSNVVVPRPRRASRVPARLADENGAAATTVPAVPRLAAKTSTTSLGNRKPIISAVAAGKATITVASRRALGDLSNATRVVATEKSGKDGVTIITKPTRSRTVSASGTTTTSIGTGFSRLKIGATATATTKPVRSLSESRTLGVKESTQSLRSEERFPQNGRPSSARVIGDDLIVSERSLDGLGVKMESGNDWVANEMYGPDIVVDEVMDHAPSTSLKRDHVRAISSDTEEEEEGESIGSKVRIIETDMEDIDPDDWLIRCNLDEGEGENFGMLQGVRETFDEQLDYWDTTMVAEYSEEIFQYMSELEDKAMPNPRYMEHQTEIEWSMRTTLIDWLLQVHMRYHMLPETLWIAINIVDRFLSNRVVSLIKFQLVGVTAMFVAAKYEEIMAPSVDEFVYMTEKGYTKDEIIKGERIILQSLEFNISPYCSPYSWVRRISKADDYDIQTRTLSKFLMEVTLLDHKFLRARPSMIAAIGMFLARKMLGGEWNESFIYYSNYTENQLIIPTNFLLELIAEDEFEQKFVYKKYANKKFLKASIFARNWAKTNPLLES